MKLVNVMLVNSNRKKQTKKALNLIEKIFFCHSIDKHKANSKPLIKTAQLTDILTTKLKLVLSVTEMLKKRLGPKDQPSRSGIIIR